MCKVVNCLETGCEAQVMEERGYCARHGGPVKYKKDKATGKFNKSVVAAAPASEPPITPPNLFGQTPNARLQKLRQMQCRGGANTGIKGVTRALYNSRNNAVPKK